MCSEMQYLNWSNGCTLLQGALAEQGRLLIHVSYVYMCESSRNSSLLPPHFTSASLPSFLDLLLTTSPCNLLPLFLTSSLILIPSLHSSLPTPLPSSLPTPLPFLSLLQDPFHVWESYGRATDRFARGKKRHIFLYEKVIIFSKKFEAPAQHRGQKSDIYIYKNHVEVCVWREVGGVEE